MSKVSITDRLPDETSTPKIDRLTFGGDIASRVMISPDDFTLSLWRHEIKPGAKIKIDRPAEDHCFYVVAGEMLVGGTPVPSGGAASVARNAIAEISVGKSGATVLHYVGDAETRPEKAGGCVHILSEGWEERSPVSSHTLFFDSSCPTCSVWLHRTGGDRTRGAGPHFHTEDEIICVVDGVMNLGTREIATGGAIGIGKETVYSFKCGPDGMTFVNFRQADPFFVPKQNPQPAPASERVLVRDLLTRLHADAHGAPPVV